MPVDEVLLAPLNSLFMAVSLILGLLVGSFCNVCVGRWPHGESVIQPRSRCPKCLNAIAWYDNIPLLSWLMLGAKCRHCKAPISWQYPVVEALTGVLFLLVYLRFGFTLATPVYMLLAAALVIVTFQDLADWTIPNEITFSGVPAGLGLSVIAGWIGVSSGLRVIHPFDAMGGVVLGYALLYGLDKLTVLILKRPGMGLGDAKLLAMLGAFIGWKGVLGTIMLGSVLGSIVGGAVMLYFHFAGAEQPQEDAPTDGDTPDQADGDTAAAEGAEPDAAVSAAARSAAEPEADGEEDDGISLSNRYLPFGPYLAIAGLVYVFYGPELLAWYLQMLGPRY